MNGIWVRSQDKKTLSFQNGLQVVQFDDCWGICGYNSAETLGTYPTESRATEVLDEIHSMVDGNPAAAHLWFGHIVYQLPQS